MRPAGCRVGRPAASEVGTTSHHYRRRRPDKRDGLDGLEYERLF